MTPALSSRHGMVAADHRLSSQAGIEILKEGGNAVDAACAAMFAQSVVNPAGSGIGGGGFMVIKMASQKTAYVLDFRETAPAAATRNMYRRMGLPHRASRNGGLAVGVPGEVRGCAAALHRFGRIGLKRVLSPAIRYATQGFPVGPHLAKTLLSRQHFLKRFKALARVFYPKGRPLAVGQILKRPRLGKALKAIADKGPDVFYKGWIGRDIVASVRRTGGILTMKDLANYKVKWRKPLVVNYRSYRVFAMPPPSSGGVVIAQVLNMLRGKNLRAMGLNSSEYLHFLSEALQHTFADRARFLGDMDFVKIPLSWLLSKAYTQRMLKRITPKVKPPSSYGTYKKKKKAPHRGGGTSHLSVIDGKGNAVALTSTINTAFGSKVMSAQAGVVLNNEMDDFTTNPGKPNAFGLIQSENNSIVPGKRPLSSMSPTIVVNRKNRVRLVLGGSGGPTIITGTLQVLLNVLDFGLDLNDAVSRSRIHHQWMPPRLVIERDLPRDVVRNLKRRGHKTFSFRKPFTAVQAVERRKGRLYGASDPRKHGKAVGY